jgi:hypothetical protein
MRRKEEFAGHLGPHPRPISSGQGSARGQAGCRIDHREASCHFEAEWADASIEDLEWRAQLDHVLEVAGSEVWPFELLLPQLGQRV